MIPEYMRQPILSVVSGSRLYGNARFDGQGNCISDEDVRDVAMVPFEELISANTLIGKRPVTEFDLPGDHKVWTLKTFLSMLLKGNMQGLECMMAPQQFQKVVTPIGERLLGLLPHVVSKHYFNAIFGYAHGEWRRVRGVKLIVPERTKTEDQVIQDVLNTFNHLPKEEKDKVIEILFSQHEKKEVASKADMGMKRKIEFDKFGFSTSAACHSIRMLSQCVELMNTGMMTFPRPDAALLSKIKRGELSYPEIEILYKEHVSEAEEAYKSSSLPEKPNPQPLWDFFVEVSRKTC